MVTCALAVISTGVLALLVARYEPLPVIMAVAAMGVMVALCLWPDGATPLAVFVLYANLPAVLEDSVPQIASVGLLGLLLALPLVHHVVIRREGLWVDRPLRLMLLFLGVLLVSAVGAVSAAVAADRIVLFIGEGVIVYALMLNVVRTGRTLRRVMATIVFTSAFLACLTVYQSVSGNYHQQFGGLAGRMLEYELVAEKEGNLKRDPGEVRMRAADRARGPLDGPNRFAQILLMALPIGVYGWWRASGMARLAFGAATVLVGTAVVLTYSRGAFVAIALMLPVVAVWRYVRPLHLAGFVVAAALAAMTVAPAYVGRIATIGNSLALFGDDAEVADGAIRGRATEMAAALTVFLEHPVIGVGPGQYARFYSADYHDRFSFRDLPRPRRAHNLFLEMAAETGIVGLTVFVWLLWVLSSGLLRERRRWLSIDPDKAHIATALFFSVLAYVATGLFLHLAYERYLWFLLGVSGAALRLTNDETGLSSARSDGDERD